MTIVFEVLKYLLHYLERYFMLSNKELLAQNWKRKEREKKKSGVVLEILVNLRIIMGLTIRLILLKNGSKLK